MRAKPQNHRSTPHPHARHTTTPLYICLLFLLCLASSACNQSTPTEMTQDAGNTEAIPEQRCYAPAAGKPRLSTFDFLGQEALKPRTLRFRIAWEDGDANLHRGKYQFWIDDQALPPQDFPTEMASATSGTIRLSLTLPKATYTPGESIKIAFEVRDEDDQRSNRPIVRLEAQR